MFITSFGEQNITYRSCSNFRIHLCIDAAIQYGNIKASLRNSGRLISDNDLHIAAHARSKGLVLVTNNSKEFERVPALQLENWVNSP